MATVVLGLYCVNHKKYYRDTVVELLTTKKDRTVSVSLASSLHIYYYTKEYISPSFFILFINYILGKELILQSTYLILQIFRNIFMGDNSVR